MLEYLLHRQAIGALDGSIHLLNRKWRNLILQFRKFIGNVERDQVAPCGQYLAKFHKYRAERLQCQTQALATRARKAAPEQRHRQHRAQYANAFMTEYKFVESVAQRDKQD